MANLFGRDRKPEGPAWGESRGAPCRQGAGDVAGLPCPRERGRKRKYRNRVRMAIAETQDLRSRRRHGGSNAKGGKT